MRDVEGYGVAFGDGKVFVTGQFESWATFGGTTLTVNSGNLGMFVAALNPAEALVRENRLVHHSRNSENHPTYAEALRQSGYQGDNGVVVLSKKMSAARVRGAMNLVADALISMSQTQGKKVARIEEEGVDS